jgi:hypothetical protein
MLERFRSEPFRLRAGVNRQAAPSMDPLYYSRRTRNRMLYRFFGIDWGRLAVLKRC